MAATVITSPSTPASCYRPLQYVVRRTDPAGTLIEEVFIADSGDVSTLGSGLAVGDVVVKYTGSIFGGIPVVAGQTILMDSDCGPYEGVQLVTLQFDDGGDHYAVIDALDAGDFTPASAFVGSFKVWLDNYTIHLKILVYTNPAGTPHEVLLKASPGANTDVKFNVDLRIKDYFNSNISGLAKAVTGGGVVQDAHGITALFYRVHIAEVYDVPGETALVDPYDGDHDILVDDVEDDTTLKVAVNGVHPFAGANLNWTTADFSDFVVGSSASRFLTDAPNELKVFSTDRFRLHMLTDSTYEADYILRLYDITTGSEVYVGQKSVDLSGVVTSSFSVSVGPADLGAFFTVPAKYRVRLINTFSTIVSENFDFVVDSKCKEVKRPFGWLNKLGGFDAFTFTGREISTSKVKRATVNKPYSTGTGYDSRTRTYRAEPERSRMVSTAPVNRDYSKWLVEDLGESPNVVTTENSVVCPVVLTSADMASHTTGPFNKPVTIEYLFGVDNLSQQA